MAKKPQSATDTGDDIIDAETVEITDDDQTEQDPAEVPKDTATDAEAVENDAQISDVPTADDSPPVPAEPVETAPERRSGTGFLALAAGGVVAGLIGYGVAQFQGTDSQDQFTAQFAQQDARIDGLRDDLAAIPQPPDLSGLETMLSELTAQQAQIVTDIESRIAEIDARIVDLEKQPEADGTLSQTAIAAYEREIADIRARMDGQQSELQAMVDATTAQLDQTRAEAAAIEANAVASARAAVARTALSKVQTALESGAPFGAALSELGGAVDVAVPDALSQQSDGIPTLSQLQNAFPAAAREALTVARQEGAAGEGEGGLTAFLRSQLNVRSVAPREGDSADAILSRAEAALREGRLSDAMAETASLPEVSRGAMTDWLAQAEQRAAALDAAATLSAHINEL